MKKMERSVRSEVLPRGMGTHMKMRAVLCRRSCSCLVEPLLRMLRWMMLSSGSSSSRIRGCSGCLVTSTSIRSSTCGQKTGNQPKQKHRGGRGSSGCLTTTCTLTRIWKSRRSCFSFCSLFFSSCRAWMRSFCSANRLARFWSRAIIASSPSSSSSSLSTPP